MTVQRGLTVRLAALASCALLIASCRSPGDPLADLQRSYDRYPQYSIILSDMDVSGNFFKTYHHRYKVLYGEQTPDGAGGSEAAAPADPEVAAPAGPEVAAPSGSEAAAAETEGETASAPAGLNFETTETQWLEVDRKFYQTHELHLGMVLLSKGEDGQVEQAAYPPGYQYVGNPRYGTWRSDARGNSFWEFYGQYYFFSRLLGGHGRPIYRSDYDSYRDSRRRRAPYFGAGNAYGTRGSYTRTTNPSFYERQQVRQRSQSDRFTKKARSRTSSARSRSRSHGK
ncbi:MAG: hypothetical protein AAF657_10905 [Acidobacteriota bacterium]